MNTRKNRWSRGLSLLLALVLLLGTAPAAWAEGETPTVRITNDVDSLKVGESVQLTVEVTPAGAPVEWVCEDPAVARVDQKGLVTGLSEGTATITANVSVTVGDQTLTAATNVKIKINPQDPPPTVAVSPKSLKLQVGSSGDLTAKVSNGAPVTWASSDTSVAVVSSGTVTAVGVGKATVTASAGGALDTCEVTVSRAVTGVTLSASEVGVSVNGSVELFAKVQPDDATNKQVVWSSSNSSVAEVDGNGMVTGKKKGSAVITVRTEDGNKTAVCTVNVEEGTKPPSGVSVFPAAADVVVGGTVQLSAQVQPAGADLRVAWTTSDGSVATVSASGLVTGCKEGTALITATAVNGGKSASCAVTVRGGTAKVTGVTLSPAAKTLSVGETLQLTPTVQPASAGNKAVRWSSSSDSIATVNASGLVTAKGAGKANITVTTEDGNYTATCTVTVESIGISLSASTMTLQSDGTGVLWATTVPSNQSNLVTWKSGNTNIVTVSASSGGTCSLIPKATGSTTVTATLVYQSKTYTASCKVTVTQSAATVILYRVDEDEPVTFNDTDFNRVCQNLTGYDLDYVKFSLPSSSRGTLYYDYDESDTSNTKVSSSAKYSRNSPKPYIDRVTFVPKEGYAGVVTIDYTGWNDNGKEFSGQVEVTVGEGSGGTGDIKYTTRRDTPVTLDADDFADYCKDYTGYTFDCVQFTSLPSSSRGTLYYDYSASDRSHTAVRASTLYYRAGSPYLDEITFVPDEDFTGTVIIPFTGYNSKNKKFTGELSITVGGSGEISYTTGKDAAVDLLERDFVDYSRDQTGRTFDYIQFTTLPSSSRGTLYYDYRGATSKNNEAVERNSKYYRAESPYLDEITFVPDEDFTGTVSIPFTGYSDRGERFTGSVKITVGSGGDVTYSATAGQSVDFAVADFNSYCKSETGSNLDFVQFTLPNSSQGALYSGSKKATSSSTKYYRTSPSPYVDDVSFSPAKSATGAVRIPFTGESVKGDAFSGTVVISYTAAPAVIKYSSTGGAVTFKTQDFSNVCSARGGGAALSTVRFNTVSATNGKLYASYANGAGTAASTGTAYRVSGSPSLGNVTFVPKSGYSGKVNFTYTATDADGGTYQGAVEITVTPAASTTSFKDMGNYSWAASSVDYLSKSGVVTGLDSTHYGPEKPITRGDFVLMLYRAFDMKSSGKSSFSDVSQSSYYAEAVAAAKALGIATGSDGKFNPTAPLTRQDAMVLIQRTMSATGRPLTAGTTSTLNSFTDKGKVADYAANAVAALVRSGLIQGDGGKLNPTATITRAEMAVLLHRVLTM